MNCERFEELLFEALDGAVGERLAAELDAHARACERCAELRRIATGDLEALVGEPDELLGGILNASGVDACSRARERLVESAPEALDSPDPLLSLHVGSCAGCGAVHRALLALRRDLPALAELEPDADFVADVMAATAAAPRWSDRLQRWWQRILARPRLALEGAYVGTLVVALTFVTPAAAITDIPGRVLQGLRSDSEVRRTLTDGWDGLARAGAEGWQAMAGRIEAYADSAPSLAEARARVGTEVAGWTAELKQRWQRLREWLIDPLIERVRALLSATEGPEDGRDNQAGAERPDNGANDERGDDRRAGADI